MRSGRGRHPAGENEVLAGEAAALPPLEELGERQRGSVSGTSLQQAEHLAGQEARPERADRQRGRRGRGSDRMHR